MNIIRYTYYLITNFVLNGLLIVLPWMFGAAMTQAIILSIIGLGGLVPAVFSYRDKDNEVYKRINLLINFVAAIIVSFLPFIAQYANNQQLVLVSVGYSFLTLIIIFVTNFETSNN